MQVEQTASPWPRSVAVVGNAPDLADQSRRIDAADWVVRFNNAAGFGGRAGSRVTHLALVNHGGQMREWLEDPDFLNRPAIRAAGTFFFPFPQKDEPALAPDADGRCWTREAMARLSPLGGEVTVLPDRVRRDAEEILAASGQASGHAAAAPSTGFLVLLHLVGLLPPSLTIDVHGFGFEGWSGHDWKAERQWFEDRRRDGRLRLHAPTASLAA